MKTHELSRDLLRLIEEEAIQKSLGLHSHHLLDAIKDVARLLAEGPNAPLSEVCVTKRSNDIAVGLRVLSSLSRYTKQQWLALVNEYKMDIQLNPRDSARDVLGKVLRYLEAHPETVRVLGTRTRRTKVDTSELENALTKLLDRKDE